MSIKFKTKIHVYFPPLVQIAFHFLFFKVNFCSFFHSTHVFFKYLYSPRCILFFFFHTFFSSSFLLFLHGSGFFCLFAAIFFLFGRFLLLLLLFLGYDLFFSNGNLKTNVLSLDNGDISLDLCLF